MKIPLNVLHALSDPLPFELQPYAVIAKRAGISEGELLLRIRKLKKQGIIRRVGVVLGHFKVGYKHNAMVVWKVDPARLERTGKILAGFPAVTHCYAREAYAQWPFNLYSMVHARNKKESAMIIKAMAKKAGAKDYKVLSTLKEFKKTRSNLREILK